MKIRIDLNPERIRARFAIALSVSVVVLSGFVTLIVSPLSQESGSEMEILFLSDRNGNIDVYSMHSDGSEVRLFLSSSSLGEFGYIDNVNLSPDGSVLAVAYAVPDNSGFPLREIYLVNVPDGDITQLTHDGRDNWNPVWSPDGSRLAILQRQYGDAYLVNPQTGEKQLLIGSRDIPISVDDSGGFVSAIDWTSNEQLVLSLDIGGPLGYESLYFINSDGTGVQRILPEDKNGHYPVWQPGSNLIYFVCGGYRAICQLDPATEAVSQITDLSVSLSPDILIGEIDVSSTGLIVIRISLITFSGVVRDIYTFDPQTYTLVNISFDHQNYIDTAPRWINDPIVSPTPAESQEERLSTTAP